MKYADSNGAALDKLIPAELAHIAIGAELHLGDPRKTPVTVVNRYSDTASFTVRIDDFEDKGAEWELPLWDISNFLTAPNSPRLTATQRQELGQNIQALNRRVQIPANKQKAENSQVAIATLQNEIRGVFQREKFDLSSDLGAQLEGTEPDANWCSALDYIMNSKGLLKMDRAFAMSYASNPNAGEMIKGHRIVLAELGLCAYDGHILRDPQTIEGEWSKHNRGVHILTRLAFMRVSFATLGLPSLPLYRTIYSNKGLKCASDRGFVSATFNQDVAMALFEAGKKTRTAAMIWQQVPTERLFMSFLETPPLSARYKEAEAVLLSSQAEDPF